MTGKLLTFAAAATVALVAAIARADTPVTVSIDMEHAGGHAVAERFLGLSYESKLLRPDEKGRHYFSPDNKPLIQMFKTLNVRSLRVGGNTADNPAVPFPSHEDIDLLYAFAKAADAKVIFTLRLRETTD